MNNTQSGIFTETIFKEQRARARWLDGMKEQYKQRGLSSDHLDEIYGVQDTKAVFPASLARNSTTNAAVETSTRAVGKSSVPQREEVKKVATRQVTVPTTVVKEVEEEVMVEIPTTKIVEIDAYRVEEIPAKASGRHVEAKVVGLFDVADPRIRDVPLHPSYANASSLTSRVMTPSSYGRLESRPQSRQIVASRSGLGSGAPSSSQGRPASQSTATASATLPRIHNVSLPSITSAKRSLPAATGEYRINLGLKLANSEQNGVSVTSVEPKGAGEVAGVRKGDLIAYVNNKPTRNMEEFKAVVNNSSGNILVAARRRGVAKLLITIKA